MSLKEIIDKANIMTDESLPTADLLNLANKGVSRINTEVKTRFPFYVDTTSEYNAIPKMWQVDLISAFLSYSIKMNDSSLSEANVHLEEFYRILTLFKDNMLVFVDNFNNGDTENGIDPMYVEQNGFGGVYTIDTSNAINLGFFGNNGNGGCY